MNYSIRIQFNPVQITIYGILTISVPEQIGRSKYKPKIWVVFIYGIWIRLVLFATKFIVKRNFPFLFIAWILQFAQIIMLHNKNKWWATLEDMLSFLWQTNYKVLSSTWNYLLPSSHFNSVRSQFKKFESGFLMFLLLLLVW